MSPVLYSSSHLVTVPSTSSYVSGADWGRSVLDLLPMAVGDGVDDAPSLDSGFPVDVSPDVGDGARSHEVNYHEVLISFYYLGRDPIGREGEVSTGENC